MSDKQGRRYTPWVIAHRGFSAAYPENTELAFEAALRESVNAIELDLQWTRDEVVVCYHDRTLHKMGAGRMAIRNCEYSDLMTIDAGRWFDPSFAGQRLLRLDEILDRFGQRTQLFLEIKEREAGNRKRLEGLMAQVLTAVGNRGLSDQVAILCFDFDLLIWAYAQDPRMRYILNQQKPRLMAGDHFLFGYNLGVNYLSQNFVNAIRQKGKAVFTYPVDSPKRLGKVLAMNVDGIISADPAWLRHMMVANP